MPLAAPSLQKSQSSDTPDTILWLTCNTCGTEIDMVIRPLMVSGGPIYMTCPRCPVLVKMMLPPVGTRRKVKQILIEDHRKE